MKRSRSKPKQKLTLAKESVRKLSARELSSAAGGKAVIQNAQTVTFPLCCRTA